MKTFWFTPHPSYPEIGSSMLGYNLVTTAGMRFIIETVTGTVIHQIV